MNSSQKVIVVIFGKKMPRNISIGVGTTVVAERSLQREVDGRGGTFVELDEYVGPGSVYEAADLLKRLSRVCLPDGKPISESFSYNGFQLWWAHYAGLFSYFCFPYTQYQKLLEYVREFDEITLYRPPYRDLFAGYLSAYGRSYRMVPARAKALPFGVGVQIVLTFAGALVLLLRKERILVFTSDKFDADGDYDFRLKYIYEELRGRRIPFFECIRSLESWETVMKHAIVRRRAALYSEALVFIGRGLSCLFGGRTKVLRQYGKEAFHSEQDPQKQFMLRVASHYLRNVYDDIWAIRIMSFLVRYIGVKAAYVTTTLDRNFHTVVACKLNDIPVVGILHGMASLYGTPYDFMPGFKAKKKFSVDVYGVWSEWWKERLLSHGDAYFPEQLCVSGPMRPLSIETVLENKGSVRHVPRVLFIAEQTVAPQEVLPYLRELLRSKEIELTIKFRPYRDGFEEWLRVNEPALLQVPGVRIVKGGMQDAIKGMDVVIGCHSTAVLEALLQTKPPLFLLTRRWGDYYELAASPVRKRLLVDTPGELIARIRSAREIPQEDLVAMRDQYFGDPHKNGSVWVVDQLQRFLGTSRVTMPAQSH